jgi:hypothetical protein
MPNHEIPAVQSYMRVVEENTESLKKQKSMDARKVIALIHQMYLYGVNSGIRGLTNKDARDFLKTLGSDL